MDKGAANHGDSSQRHAYDLHGVGYYQQTYAHTGHAIPDPGFTFSTNDINDGFNPFNAVTAHGGGYNNDDLSPSINNVDASLYPYDNAATPSFTHGAVQEATVTPNANVNFNGGDGGIGGPSNRGRNNADYYGQTLCNITAPGIAYDQGLSAALPLQYSNGVYPTAHANANFYPPNNGAAIGSAHGSSGYATNTTALGAELTDSTSTVCSSLPASTADSVGSHHFHYGNSVYPDDYSDVKFFASNNATSTVNGMVQGSNGYAINGTALGAPSTGATTTMSSTLSPSTSASVGDYYHQHGDTAYPTSYANGISTPTAISMAHANNNHATALAVPSASATPTTSSALSPSTPGSVTEPNGRPRWACTGCAETFSRQADMVRHARKHSGVLPYQCPVANCKYKGSYRQDKLEQHRRNCH